jgi:serine protease inhibitor
VHAPGAVCSLYLFPGPEPTLAAMRAHTSRRLAVEDGNVVVSPVSIAVALAMATAGETAVSRRSALTRARKHARTASRTNARARGEKLIGAIGHANVYPDAHARQAQHQAAKRTRRCGRP